MNDYYTINKAGEGIYNIFEPAGVCSSLIIGTKKALLIDTGYGFENIKAAVTSLTSLPLTVANTHGHLDHTGGNEFFDKVYINWTDKEVYETYWKNHKRNIVEKFEQDTRAKGVSNVWPESFQKEEYINRKAENFIPLENGQIFDLGDRKVEAIFLPGHTKGSVLFFDWKTGILFTGDDIGNSLWIQFDVSEPLYSYAAKLDILRKYPVKYIVFSHNRDLLPGTFLDDLKKVIKNLTLEKSRVFVHPRTKALSKRYKEKVDGYSGVQYIYIVYDENNMGDRV